MKIKEGVIMTPLKIEMRVVLVAADKVWKEFGEELVVTEALGGTHSAGSLHYYGYALDLRTRYFEPRIVSKVHKRLRNELSQDYDIVVHQSHIHVEYDPK